MKNAISAPQATSSKGLIPSFTSALQSSIKDILDIFKVMFAKQKGDGGSSTERPKVTSVKIKTTTGVAGSGQDKTWVTLVTTPSPSTQNLEGWDITLKCTDPSIPNRVITDTSKYTRQLIHHGGGIEGEVTYYCENLFHKDPNPRLAEAHFNNGTEVEIDEDLIVVYNLEK